MRIAIVGGGILGRLVAFFCLKQGHQPELFEKNAEDAQTSPSFVAAGMLSPYCELEDKWLASLGQPKHWAAVLTQLSQPVFFQQTGTLAVAHSLDLPALEHLQRSVHSYFGEQVYRLVGAAELAELEPELAGRFDRGIFLTAEGQIDSSQAMQALATFLIEQAKVHWQTAVTAIKPNQIIVGTQAKDFDWVIDCRGLSAKPSLKTLRGVRGEIIRVRAPEVNFSRPIRLAHPKHSLYIVPLQNQEYLIGATLLEVEDYSEISVQSALELLSAAYTVHTGFAEARILKMVTQCRPSLPNNLPKIFWKPGLMRINGLFRHGYLLSPKVAELAVNFLLTQQIPEIATGLFEHILDEDAETNH